MLKPTFLLFAFVTVAIAQDRLKTMPGYARYERINREATNVFKSGALTVAWTNEGGAFDYTKDGRRYRYDIALRTAQELATTNTVARRTNAARQCRAQFVGASMPRLSRLTEKSPHSIATTTSGCAGRTTPTRSLSPLTAARSRA